MITKNQYEQAMLVVEEYILQLKKAGIAEKEGKEQENPFLNTHLFHVDFSVRAHNCLKNLGVNYVSDIIQYSYMDLFSKRHFGRKTLKEIESILNENGLCLKRD